MANDVTAAQLWLAQHADDPMAPQVRAKLEKLGVKPAQATSTITGKAYKPPASNDPTISVEEQQEDSRHTGPEMALHYLAKAAPPLGAGLGGSAGVLTGAPAGPAAVLTGAVGAGVGAAGGRALQIKADQLAGYPAPNLLDPKTLHQLALEASINALFQGGIGATGLGAGAIGKGMDPGRVRNMLLGFSKYTGGMSPEAALRAKGTMLEPLEGNLLDELITNSASGKAAVPAAAGISDRLGARIPVGLKASNAAEGVPQLTQALSGTVPEQAKVAGDLKDAVRAAIAKNALKSGPGTGGTNPGSVVAAQKLIKPEDMQAGFENTSSFVPTADDPAALAAAAKVKDLSSKVGAGWRSVNEGRQAALDATAQGARGVPDATQKGVLDAFVNANTKRGLSREAGHETMGAAALIGNRARHALAEVNPWSAGSPIPKAADAARSLEVEAASRGLPAVDPSLRLRLGEANNPAALRAIQQAALEQWLYGDRDQPAGP